MSKKTLIDVCSACEKAEIKILVIPLVDNSSIDKLNSTSKGEIIEFFREGKKYQWQNNLDLKFKNLIESGCKKEMKELGYL